MYSKLFADMEEKRRKVQLLIAKNSKVKTAVTHRSKIILYGNANFTTRRPKYKVRRTGSQFQCLRAA